jgi:hypothetical protein
MKISLRKTVLYICLWWTKRWDKLEKLDYEIPAQNSQTMETPGTKIKSTSINQKKTLQKKERAFLSHPT